MDGDFQDVLGEMAYINESIDAAHVAMNGIPKASEDTADAVNQQAAMTGQIQTRLEKTHQTASGARETTKILEEVVVNGKKLADELQNQSVLVNENTTKISETVEMLVSNVQKVSSITDSESLFSLKLIISKLFRVYVMHGRASAGKILKITG